ncbi:MAG: cell division protein SepF [Clostridia bacterium]|nr:cell division protein SepF [Clostridia bacterium]
MNIFDKIKNGMANNENAEADTNYGPYDTDMDTEEQYVEEQDVVGMTGSSLQLKVVKPASYGEAKQIARHLLDGKTVVLNLEGTQKEDARHLIDFLHGVVYSIEGNFKNVAANTFIITPNNVDVTGDSAAAALENTAEEN